MGFVALSMLGLQFVLAILAVLIVVTAMGHTVLVGYYVREPWEEVLWILLTLAFGEFTRDIERLTPGEIVYLDGPYGCFSLDDADAPLVLIGGGVGATPLASASGWCDVRTPRVSMSAIVLVIGAFPVACSAIWARLAQSIVPDVCTEASPPTNAGPLRCGD